MKLLIKKLSKTKFIAITSIAIVVAVIIIFTAVFYGISSGSRSVFKNVRDFKEVKISAADYSVLPSGNKIVTSSIPLPKGAISSEANLVVLNSSNKEMPAQTRVLNKWPDGSLQWVLVDFIAGSGSGNDYTVRYSTAIKRAVPKTSLAITQQSNLYTINTGSVKFDIGGSNPWILGNMYYNGVQLINGGITAQISANYPELSSCELGPPEKVEIIDNGPVRARFRIEGKHSNGFSYSARVDVFAGEAAVNVDYTFINTTNKLYYTNIKDISMKIPVVLGDSIKMTAGRVDGPAIEENLGGDPKRLFQKTNTEFYVNGKIDDKSKQLSGMVALTGQKYGLMIAGVDFWQQYPKSYILDNNNITYNLWPEESQQICKLGEGASKSHEIWILPYSSNTNTASLEASAQSLTGRRYGIIDTQSYLASTALFDCFDPSKGVNSQILDKAEKVAAEYISNVKTAPWNDLRYNGVQRTGWYGMFDWGDWLLTPKDNEWGNLEYDFNLALIDTYALAGDPDLFDVIRRGARHYMDVDRLHASVDNRYGERSGMNHVHKMFHFSLDKDATFDFGHTWATGLFQYYYISGDEMALKSALEITQTLKSLFDARIKTGEITSHNPRQFGWPMLSMMAAYRQTGDTGYMDTVSKAIPFLMKKFNPGPDDYWSRFDLGVMLNALTDYHILTGDKDVEKYLVEYAENMYKGKDQFHDIRFYPAVAYVYSLNHDQKLKDLCEKVLLMDERDGWSWTGKDGKSLGMVGNHTFRTSYLLYMNDK